MYPRRRSRARAHHLVVCDGLAGTAPRLNRLPQRLDYTLIPAPLDLSRPLVDEKAELPAIIVTPSSPVFESEFFIAFLAPPPSPTLTERLSTMVPSLPSLHSSARGFIRTAILLLVLLFIMGSHLVMHRIATSHPHLEFGLTPEQDISFSALSKPVEMDVFGARVDAGDVVADTPSPSTAGWFDFNALWAAAPATNTRSPKDFVVEETLAPIQEQTHDNDNASDRPQADPVDRRSSRPQSHRHVTTTHA
ncbi:hypothetical protein C2E23DRAFT_736183 [Lenzites betulinus]|nr:hypothetical protein C2E23DRAFT_736183 [Lenzites betulinus]